MSYLFIRGVNDENLIEPILRSGGEVGYRIDGSTSIYRQMDFPDQVVEWVLIFGDKVKQDSIRYRHKPTIVFNEIADADSHAGALRRCEAFCAHLGVPVINHPRHVRHTTREAISTMLQGIAGVTMPRTIRCSPRSPDEIYALIKREQLAYPVIVRLAGRHGGTSSILVRSSRDRDKLHIYPFDGRAFYLTEFADYRSSDGLYRKYRLVVVDGKLLFRHFLVSKNWMVHASSVQFAKANPALWSERMQRIASFEQVVAPKIDPAIQVITSRVKLDYFGIDCSVDDEGRILIFEVNANMNVLHNPTGESTAVVNEIKAAIAQMLAEREAQGRS
jgi:glutathione synthase/RimK-type ligase-like ATP-grasp enzyme